MRLDVRSKFPSGMEDYLEMNGWHFNKKMCKWASSKMYNPSKELYCYKSLEELLDKNNIKLDLSYDAVYVANMCKSDFLGSSIPDEQHLLKYVKDVIEDVDSYDGMVFTRFYADCIGKGISIPWEDLI